MTQVALTAGAYVARSVIANAQRCVNLYPEANPQETDPPAPVTHYPTPGLTAFGTPPAYGPVRGLYRASNGVLYGVTGTGFYQINQDGTQQLLGTLSYNNAPTTVGATWTSGAAIITVLNPTQIVLGMTVSASGIPGGTVVTSITGAAIGISNTTTTTQSSPLITTFTIPLSAVAYTDNSATPVSMYDNGLELVIVNGTTYGWYYVLPLFVNAYWANSSSTVYFQNGTGNLRVGDVLYSTAFPSPCLVTSISSTDSGPGYAVGINQTTTRGSAGYEQINHQVSPAFYSILDPAWQGSTRVDYLDTYFLFNVPNSPTFYCSLSLSVNFDPLYYASKVSASDYLQSIVVCRREIYLPGDRTTELWYNAGNTTFPFSSVPGAFIEHGIVAPYSIAKVDTSAFWLTNDNQGQGIVVQAQSYISKRVSNHGVEQAIQSYSTISDAIGMTYQLDGHTFYVLTFPSANATWVYDMATQQWHEWLYIDSDGNENRSRVNCCTHAYGKVIAGDWLTGQLYTIDPTNYTDNGQPITRKRSFPHLTQENKRTIYWRLVADMEVGNGAAGNDSLYLQWSDNKGKTWSTPISQSIGDTTDPNGDNISLLFTRLGIARDRIFYLYWAFPYFTALNSIFIDVESCGS